MKHHICLIGKEVLPPYYGIKDLIPDVLHLLCSADSRSEAELLKKEVAQICDTRIVVCLPNDFQDIKKKITAIISENSGAEFSMNITGGTKPMAIVANSIGGDANIPMYYYTPDNKRLNVTELTEEPHSITLDNEELLSLSNNSVKEKTNFPDEVKQNTLEAAKNVGKFIVDNPSLFSDLKTVLKQNNYLKRGFELRAELSSKSAKLVKLDNRLCIEDKKGRRIFDVTHKEAFDILFLGEWWELLVALAIHQWDTNREIWLNTITSLRSRDSGSKNEIDILVNLDTVMLFVECKSGEVSQDDVNKISTVQKIYGGRMSKSALISFKKLPDHIVEKCKDDKIMVLHPEGESSSLSLLDKIPAFMDEIASYKKT